jgi:phytoene desaturase
MARVGIIGSGFSGLSAACYLSSVGHEVQVFEKNAEPGGRARQLRTPEGFVFDMGPSWYWMPGVFERFFNDFGYTVPDLYKLHLLDPSFEMVFPRGQELLIPANYSQLREVFERVETGSSLQLDRFMDEAERKYRLGMDGLVYKPGLSITELLSPEIIRNSFSADILMSFSKHVRKFFSDRKLIQLMEFPVLFLGAKPSQIPALYSLMNYAGLKLGNWYPQGGFGSVINAMKRVAEENGVEFHFNSAVQRIVTSDKKVSGLEVNGQLVAVDGIVASADYHHVEQDLLTLQNRNYRETYWDRKVLAPSSLIFYLGVNKRLDRLQHHTLFFDENLDDHINEIYEEPQWPSKPLFYASCPSRTDPTVAPPGHENLFLLMPVAPGLEDTEELRERYLSIFIKRLEEFTGEQIRPHLVYKKSYCIRDFVFDYNSYKGNAYGLANTISQTAVLKPKIKNHKLKNLFYAGQLTVPGPGVPPSIISGKIAAGLLNNYLTKTRYEVAV